MLKWTNYLINIKKSTVIDPFYQNRRKKIFWTKISFIIFQGSFPLFSTLFFESLGIEKGGTTGVSKFNHQKKLGPFKFFEFWPRYFLTWKWEILIYTFLIICDVPPFRVFFGDFRLVSDAISDDTNSFFFLPNIRFRLFDIPIFQFFQIFGFFLRLYFKIFSLTRSKYIFSDVLLRFVL